jgi:hypothetical protein
MILIATGDAVAQFVPSDLLTARSFAWMSNARGPRVMRSFLTKKP